jgi:membrane protease YdiL (CAAX protease family)
MVFFILGAHGPLAAALIMTFKEGGWTAVKALLKSGFNFRMRFFWWLILLIIPTAIGGLTLWINVTKNNFQFDNTLLTQPIMILPTFLMMFFLGGSFQEEFGWRGFALPRLLKKWNPLVSSLILGTIWGIWHLPLFFIAGTGQYFMPFGSFVVTTVAFTILFTWIYLKTDRNLFSALLLHTALNTSFSLFPPIVKQTGVHQPGFSYLTAAYLIIALIIVVLERKTFFTENFIKDKNS